MSVCLFLCIYQSVCDLYFSVRFYLFICMCAYVDTPSFPCQHGTPCRHGTDTSAQVSVWCMCYTQPLSVLECECTTMIPPNRYHHIYHQNKIPPTGPILKPYPRHVYLHVCYHVYHENLIPSRLPSKPYTITSTIKPYTITSTIKTLYHHVYLQNILAVT